MIFETITVMQRKNTGNYEHIEISTTAKLEEGEDFFSAAMTARTYLDAVLNMPLEDVKELKQPAKEKQSPVTYDEETGTNLPVAEVEEKKKKKASKVKAKETAPQETLAIPEDIQDIPPVIPTEAKKAVVAYDRGMDAHKTMLSSHLTKNFPNWKTAKPKQQIIDFNASLHGLEFLDSDGLIVDSFKTKLESFYGA